MGAKVLKACFYKGKGFYFLPFCLVISIIIGLYELYWFLGKGSGLGLVIAVLSFVVSYICFINGAKSEN